MPFGRSSPPYADDEECRAPCDGSFVSRRSHHPSRAHWIIALVSMMWVAGMGTAAATSISSSSDDLGAWTVYHHDVAGTGVSKSVATINTDTPAWTSPALDGQLYGEPLVSSGRVFVATEHDTVYALSTSTGAVIWSTRVGMPVPATALPCGNITPTVGITGTPVIDQSRNEIFVVADELVKGVPAHMLVGLSTISGRSEMAQDVDPAGAKPSALLQRTGLTLDAGQVVFGFGGNYGDCSSYRGWIVAAEEAGGKPTNFAVDSAADESQGAIWMGGAAPAVDGSGNLWVGVANGSVTTANHAYDYSDSTLELSPTLHLLQFFAPRSWASDNAQDLDLSMEPALLSNGQVVVAGKSRIAYLLNGSHLGGVGGQQAMLRSACNDDIDGGSAVAGTTVYLPCLSGVVAVQASASPAAIRLLWSSTSGGGPPIVAAGLVWTIGQDGTLYGLDPTSGTVRRQASIGTPSNHFPTPSVGDGLLLAPSAERVVAFAASLSSSSTTTRPEPATSTLPGNGSTSQSKSANGKGIPSGAVVGIIAGGLLVIGGFGWILWRRRRPRSTT
jgi:polyvinyl alcohol dehydrogenase (cytochrome)